MAAVCATIAAATLTLTSLIAAPCFAAGATPGAHPQSVGPMPPNPTFDAKLKEYLQKRFMIADPNLIQLGPMVKTPMPGIAARMVRASNDKGQSQTVELFSDASGNFFILGQMYDMEKDPWQRIDLKPLHLTDRPAMGSPTAPVTIVEFADFECPFCAHAFSVLETMVHTTYKDKLRVIFKNYPLNVHPWARRAAAGAECARLQNPDAFWDFARDFYTNQGKITPKNIDDNINSEAKKLSLDVPTLDACMNTKSTIDRVNEDEKDGAAVGVTSTPTFFINGVRIVGLPEEKAFDWVINRQIEDATKHASK
jgi:protein-disulfide isomerase